MKNRGFEQRRHLFACNTHAACSALVLLEIVFFVWAAHHINASAMSIPLPDDVAAGMARGARSCYHWVVGLAVFELVFNVPAIILTRYLYLLTIRRPAIQIPTEPNPATTAADY
jgi:hypothetical protein